MSINPDRDQASNYRPNPDESYVLPDHGGHSEGISELQARPITPEEVKSSAHRLHRAPTAIPPKGHRDSDRRVFSEESLHSPEPQAKSWKKPAAIIGGLATVAAAGGVYATSQGGGEKPSPTPTVAVSTDTRGGIPLPGVTSEPTEPAKVYERLVDPSKCYPKSGDVNFLPPTTVECGMFENLSPTEQQVILQAEQASVPEFFKLPLENQQYFQNFVLDNNAKHALFTANKILTTNNLTGIDDYKSNFKPESNTDAVIANQISANLAIYENLNYKDETGNLVYDKTTAYKILPSIAKMGSPVYNKLLQGIGTADSHPFGTTGKMGINNVVPYTFSGIGPAESVKDVTVNGVKGKEQTTKVAQYSPSSPESAMEIPRTGDLTLTYVLIEARTLSGKATNILLADYTKIE